MLIEPAILLMFNSMRIAANHTTSTISLTTMLFDFLCRIAVNYNVQLKENILNGIMQAFKDSVEKKVIPSLQVFFTSHVDPKTSLQQPQTIDRDLRNLIQATFGTFFQTLDLNQSRSPQPQLQPQQPSPATTPPPATTLPPPPPTPPLPTTSPSQSPTTTLKPLSSELSSPTSSIPLLTPSTLLNIGSSNSFFKQKVLVDEEISLIKVEPAQQASSLPLSSEPAVPKFETQTSLYAEPIKAEALMQAHQAEMTKLTALDTHSDAFSSDEEENEMDESMPSAAIANNMFGSSSSTTAIVKPATNTPAPSTLLSGSNNMFLSTSPSPVVSSIQMQLQQFTLRPFKIYTTLEDVQTVGALLSSINNNNCNSSLQNLLSIQVNALLENSLNSLSMIIIFFSLTQSII